MEIPRFDSIGTSAGANIPTLSNENDMAAREVVTAVHEVNKSELMGEGRQLTFSYDPQTRRPVIARIHRRTQSRAAGSRFSPAPPRPGNGRPASGTGDTRRWNPAHSRS